MADREQRARRAALWKECAAALLLYLLVLILPAIGDTITAEQPAVTISR